MIKLGSRCIVQKSRPSSKLGVIAPRGCAPRQNVTFCYDVEKISAGCLVNKIMFEVLNKRSDCMHAVVSKVHARVPQRIHISIGLYKLIVHCRVSNFRYFNFYKKCQEMHARQ